MVSVQEKRCSRCGVVKDVAGFGKSSSKRDGLQHYCKDCMRLYSHQYHKATYEPSRKVLDPQVIEERRQRLKERRRVYWQLHKQEINARRKTDPKDRARRTAYRRRYQKTQKWQEYYVAWMEANRDKTREKSRRYYMNKRTNGGRYTDEQWQAICLMYGNKCLACGMPGGLTPDHVIPLSKGGTSDISNIQPLCFSCNASKRDKIIDYRPST